MLQLSLRGGVSADSKCVNVRLKQVAKGIINHTMPPHPAHAGKSLRDYCNVKVTLSIPGTRVSNVQLTLIPNQ